MSSNIEVARKIKSVYKEAAYVYSNQLGLALLSNNITLYNSPLDACKGAVASTNVNNLCQHFDNPGDSDLAKARNSSKHSFRNNIVSSFKTSHNGTLREPASLWTCHKITSIARNDVDINYNRSCSSARSIFMLETSQNDFSVAKTLIHELNHQLGASDHYHEADEDGNCVRPNECVDCNLITGGKSRCVMYDNIQFKYMCSDCIEDILTFLQTNNFVY